METVSLGTPITHLINRKFAALESKTTLSPRLGALIDNKAISVKEGVNRKQFY